MVALPAEAVRRFDLHQGDEVTLEVEPDAIVVRPGKDLRALLGSWEPMGDAVKIEEIAADIRADRNSH
ncbi:MAG: AbrB/MazE/SpoVT family DNA-binding domain-containing protein [Candidatus Dormibacteraeota bacterium]|nr:AbrB/MazE/SpoVT family DNA-binding domain-containing protein [Candidatus Dormibacteraeota bacterium]